MTIDREWSTPGKRYRGAGVLKREGKPEIEVDYDIQHFEKHQEARAMGDSVSIMKGLGHFKGRVSSFADLYPLYNSGDICRLEMEGGECIDVFVRDPDNGTLIRIQFRDLSEVEVNEEFVSAFGPDIQSVPLRDP